MPSRGRRIFSWFITRLTKPTRRLYKELRTAVLKAERLENDLQTMKKVMEDEAADTQYERACMMERIQQLEERESLIRAVISADDPAEQRNIAEHPSRYHTTGHELAERRPYPNWESGEWEQGRSEEVRKSSSTTVPLAASMSDDSTDGQSEMCPICLCGFVAQEVGTPEACNHSFCADCLQGWLKNTNTCPVDRQVCDTILVRRSLRGEVVRRVHVEPPRQQEEDEVIDYLIYCEVCGGGHPYDPPICCDACGRGYHVDCIYPRLDTVTLQTLEEWFCSDCARLSSPYVESERDY